MNINSSSYYSVGGSTSSASNGISGLMSGMDTEAMVEKMLSGTQGKIDKNEALKQQTLWKQDIYRDVITSINTFRNKYFNTKFGASSKNNFASASFFNAMRSAVKSGDALKVTGSTSSTATGDIKVKVKQLASATSLTSDVNLSTNKITGSEITDEAMNSLFNRQLALDITTAGGSKKSLAPVDLNGVKSQEDLAAALNAAFAADANFSGVTASVDKGILHLTTSNPDQKLSVNTDASTTAALKLTGLEKNSTTEVKGKNDTVSGHQLGGNANVSMDTGLTFDLTLDGVSKTVKLNNVAATSGGKVTMTDVEKALQSEVKKAFGGYVKVELDPVKKAFAFGINLVQDDGTVESGHELVITGSDAKKLGLTPGASTRISYATKLGDLGLGGDKFEFAINGVDFKFDGTTSVNTMMNAINSSTAGVRMSYSSLTDSFKLESSATGKQYGIEIEQSVGNVMGTLFGNDKVAASNKVISKKLLTDGIQGNDLGSYTTKEAKLTMSVNGVSHTFSLPKKDGDASYNKDEIETKFNEWLAEKFSETAPDGTETAQITYADGKLNVLSDKYTVKFAATSVDTDDEAALDKAKETDLALAMGLNLKETSNEATAETKIENILRLKDMDAARFQAADGTQVTTLGNLRKLGTGVGASGSAIELTATFSDGRLTLSGTGTVDLTAEKELSHLLGMRDGQTSLELGDGKMNTAEGTVNKGTDALIDINGVETSRSGNSFTIDGITMELTKVSNEIKDASGTVTGYEETVISSTRDIDSVVEGFKTFVDDYNAMLEKLNGYVDEEPNYQDYPPLTAAQKKEMSESEIKLWEEKSKQGLVRRDSTINTFLSEMRLAMYSRPATSNLALYNIGVDTSNYKDKGKLYLDETKLRSALTTDPESVNDLFTDATDGLAATMTKAMKNAAETSSGSAGALVQLAGIKGATTEKNNTLYLQIETINDRISDLKQKYERERNRYWNQFNSMESILSNYNSQSMWMTQQFGGQ